MKKVACTALGYTLSIVVLIAVWVIFGGGKAFDAAIRSEENDQSH